MILNTKTNLSSLIRQGFGGKAVELLRDYPHFSILERERAQIGEMIKVISGPLYYGEAEYALLDPLLVALQNANAKAGDAAVARHAYQIAAAYALIFDISKISQSKDIAKEVTIDSIRVQPIIQLFKQRANVDDASRDIKEIWEKVDDILSNGLLYKGKQNDQSRTTPLSLLYQATSPSSVISTAERDTVKVWSGMLEHLRHGKGTPLDRGGRKAYMANLSDILLRIDQLIAQAKVEVDQAQMSVESGSRTVESTAFVDAYTAMYWLKIYLMAVQEYDVIFPSSEVMIQSQAWVMTIKSQSAKLKKLFIDIAQSAMSFDIFTAIRYWTEVQRFWDPLINKSLSVVSDMNSLWTDTVAKADKMLSAYAKQQVMSVFDNFKQYFEAEFLLPEEDFAVCSDILEIFQSVKPVATDGVFIAKTGNQVVTDLDTVGERLVPSDDRDILIPKLAAAASSIEDALSYVKRAREILQLSEDTDDVYHALLPEGMSWNNPYALTGTIEDLHVASFERTDPMQLAYEKYVVTLENTGTNGAIGSLDWRFTSLLMRPFYKRMQLKSFAEARSAASRIIWPGIPELPVSDVITVQYLAQPIPACYTASRNSNFVTNDMVSYVTLMSGHSGITTSSRDMFRKIAGILKTFESTYGRSILDALAATMFVYKIEGDKWKILEPSCPTIYGMPLRTMIDENLLTAAPKVGEATYGRVTRVSLDSGEVYAFVLHSRMPQPGPMVYFAYPYAKGAYVQIPLLESVFTASKSEIQKRLGVNFETLDNAVHSGDQLDSLIQYIRGLKGKALGGAKTMPTLGWAPFLINMPHMLCSYQDENPFLTEAAYNDYSYVSVRVRYDVTDRSLYVGGFIDNPVELIDMTDYEKHVNEADPSPLPPSPTAEASSANPDVEPEKPRSEAEKLPDPGSLGAAARNENGTQQADADLHNAGKITEAPVVEKGAVKLPHDIGQVGEREATKEVDADALAGDTGANDKGDHAPESGAKEKYWKKLSQSGEVLEIIKAVACPDGYVPASEDEYREFVLKKASEAESQKEDQQ